ncbi:hypothetical protein [Mangrovimonas aestuarii]|uniref:hypothetical protein n=1 Tax=Mangrovimonas aestuarii TaxID=3018443 RepID=UPI002379C72D|nr:hypothetical protein [Mangrovimonas aestuarii]
MKINPPILILLFILFSKASNSQTNQNEINSSYTPYELLSSYYSDNFHPFKKGNVYVGFAMSLEDRKLENTSLLVNTVLDGDRTSYDLNLSGGYFIGNYAMVGIKLNYNQEKFSGLVLKDTDTLNSQSIDRGFAFSPFVRSNVPLTANERLSFFTEVGFTFGKSNSLTREIKDTDEITKIYETSYKFKVGLTPGVTFFAMENFALEIGLDVLGYELNSTEKTTNDDEVSKSTRNNVDFQIDILSLQLGLAYYFGAGKSKK